MKKIDNAAHSATKNHIIFNKSISEFVSNIGHDICTPLIGIKNVVNLLAEDEKDDAKKYTLQEIAICTQELLHYCDNLLDFSREKITSIQPKCFNLFKLIDSVMAIERLAARSKELTFELDYDKKLPVILTGEPYGLKRILVNLIDNAIKFTANGHVKLFVSLEKNKEIENNIMVKFTIEDTGIGMSKDKEKQISQYFTKSALDNIGFKDIGLGLHIVKQFLDELGGNIHLISCLGQGSTFIVNLPFAVPMSNDMISQ